MHLYTATQAKKQECQRDFVLRLLKEAGSKGVNRDSFQTGTGPCNGRRVTQPAARLDELTKMGYRFETRQIPGEIFVRYFLVQEPLQPLPAPPVRGWKAQSFVFGRKKPPQPAEQSSLLDLPNAATGTDDRKLFLAAETGKVRW